MLQTWLVFSFAVWATAALLPGFRLEGGIKGTLTVAGVFGLLNWAIGWLLYGVIGVGTLGLGFLLGFVTRWVVNAILLVLTDRLLDSLEMSSWRTAGLASLSMSFFGSVGEWVLRSL